MWETEERQQVMKYSENRKGNVKLNAGHVAGFMASRSSRQTQTNKHWEREINTRARRCQGVDEGGSRRARTGQDTKQQSGWENYRQMPTAFWPNFTWCNVLTGCQWELNAGVEFGSRFRISHLAARSSHLGFGPGGWLGDSAVRQRANETKRNVMKSFTVRISWTSTRARCETEPLTAHSRTGRSHRPLSLFPCIWHNL